jgi:hypothetical protein
MKKGFASISLKGIQLILESPETIKIYKDNLEVILVSRREWHRLERLMMYEEKK